MALSAAIWLISLPAIWVLQSPWLVVGIPAAALAANSWILWRLLRSARPASVGDLTPPR